MRRAVLLSIAIFSIGLSACAEEEVAEVDLDDRLQRANYCTTNADCVVLEAGCPLGCHYLVNSNRLQSLSTSLQELDTGACDQKSCPAPRPYHCKQNVCVWGSPIPALPYLGSQIKIGDQTWQRVHIESQQFSFAYQVEPQGYAIRDDFLAHSEPDVVAAISIFAEEDYGRALQASGLAVDPLSTTVAIYRNPTNISVVEWIKERVGRARILKPVEISGHTAVRYRLTERGPMEIVALNYKRKMYFFSVEYNGPKDDRLRHFEQMLQLIEFEEPVLSVSL